jgi:hypothetical protein
VRKRRIPLNSGSTQRRVFFALERARSRLAVAYAAERKRTTADRWLRYLEVDGRMRVLLRRLRSGWDPAPDPPAEWIHAIDGLENLPPAPDSGSRQSHAQLLSRHLAEILEILEGQPEPPSCMSWILVREDRPS